MSNIYMIDASAVIAAVFKEPGEKVVHDILFEENQAFCITAVNAAEVIYKFMAKGFSQQAAIETFEAVNLKLLPVDYDMAKQTAIIWPHTKQIGASMGDRFCLAAAIIHNAIAVTAEKSWCELKIHNLNVRCIR